MALVKIISLRRCRHQGGTFVEHDGLELAVFRLTDPERVFVIDNTCPHSGGNLSGGAVSDCVVTCPWHGWKFDLASGVCVDSPRARVTRYRAEIRDDMVLAELPADV